MNVRALAVIGLCTAFVHPAYAFLEDAEARRAILELRQRFDSSAEEAAQMRRGMLDLQSQIESMRREMAQLNGAKEQLEREVSEIQRRQKDLAAGVDDRLRKFEPVRVQLDGLEFTADPAEKRDFDAALEKFRAGEFAEARKTFASFVNTYPSSGYVPSARFWLGNTQYAGRDYKEAIANFRSMLKAAPQHARAADAALSIANCQLELKDTKGAVKTLQDLVKDYPASEAASTAKERLQRLK
ncbi:tol-pal system protein YbgF [Comamonas sp. Sa2CVA6]|uniref:Cell division coordinator CpoB n=2 Tax=Comamonadaceae TaxID=80864 RepID=A0ABR8SDH5_9BURK|nr:MULTISPECIES: tol-pal system protein YbgF [Comamonas]MBD7961502.1 tol-pal system protein YbgF [Comamonas avium]